MDCTKVQELMLDMMNGGSAPADLSAHVTICADCTKLWQAMQVSSAALDEWTAPEPSPYFNTRFQARLAEVKREQPAGAFEWLRHGFWRPALAGAMTLAIAAGVGLYVRPTAQIQNSGGNVANAVSPAVNDLQKLEKNEDLYADFELLDDIQVDNSKPAATTTTTNSDSKTEL